MTYLKRCTAVAGAAALACSLQAQAAGQREPDARDRAEARRGGGVDLNITTAREAALNAAVVAPAPPHKSAAGPPARAADARATADRSRGSRASDPNIKATREQALASQTALPVPPEKSATPRR